MVYEFKKTVKPSDVYPSFDGVATLLEQEGYYALTFRPPAPGEHYVDNTGRLILGCCAVPSGENPRIIVAQRQKLINIWE